MSNHIHETKAGPYRSRSGLLLGVCKGLADYFDLSLFWVRAVAVLLLIFTGFWPIVGLYVLAGLLMKPEPVVPFATEDDQEFYNSFAASRPMALHRLKKTYDRLDRRLRHMEDIVTGKEYDWEKRFHQSR